MAKSAIGKTVSKLNRRLSAALISFTPRSRVLAVAMTLNPWRAKTMPSVPLSSGIATTRSDSRDSSESWTSSGQRVISSKRTILPSAMPRSIGAGTSDRVDGPFGDEQRVVPGVLDLVLGGGRAALDGERRRRR